MKNVIITGLLLAVLGICLAQNPDWQWARGAGGDYTDRCYCLTADGLGNTYIAGAFNSGFENPAHFGTTELNTDGMEDIYVAKLDPDGNWLWAVRAGGVWSDCALGIALDDTGYIYITGYFSSTANFGTSTLVSSGIFDVYVAKLDTSGNFIWAVRGGGTSYDYGSGIAVNATGIVITGTVSGDVAFGSNSLTSFGDVDIFMAKLDTNGNWLWARNAGGADMDEGTSVALDNAGNVYTTGYFMDTATFAGTTLTSLGVADFFIAKLNADGYLIAAFRAGGISDDVGTGIALDPAGNVYLTGYFNLSIAFGPFVMTSYGGTDIFITKMNSGAIYQWARQAGGTSSDEGNSITTDSQGNVYSTGSFDDSALFADVTLESYGSRDTYIAKLDTNGFQSWVVKAGGNDYDIGRGIAFNGSGNIYCAGTYTTAAVFGDIFLTSYGDVDIFVTKVYSSNTAIQDPVTPTPEAHSVLYNAYPNPLHPGQSVTIKTDIAKGESGNLSVYNLKGQLIRDYNLATGSHETSLESSNLSSGVYFYRLITPTTDMTKKLVLIK